MLEIDYATVVLVAVIVKRDTVRCDGIRVYNISASGLEILGRGRGLRLLGGVERNSGSTHRGLVGNGLHLILDIVRHFAGHKRGLSSLFRINMVNLVGTVSGFSISLGIHFSACTIPVVVNRVQQCLESGGAIHIDHSMESATCRTLKTGRGLRTGLNESPAISRVTGRLNADHSSMMLTLRTVIRPISLFRPMCSSNKSAVCIVSRIKKDRASAS